MEMEWICGGKFLVEKVCGIFGGYGKELEWKWNGIFLTNQVEIICDVMELKRKSLAIKSI